MAGIDTPEPLLPSILSLFYRINQLIKSININCELKANKEKNIKVMKKFVFIDEKIPLVEEAHSSKEAIPTKERSRAQLAFAP